MDGKTFRLLLLCALLFPWHAHAAVIDLSAMASYNKENLDDGYSSVEHRYTGTLDFRFTSVSALEFEYTDDYSSQSYPTNLGFLTSIPTTETISYHDRIYSFNWVQNLVPAKWILQPYVIIGYGRMLRHYTDSLPSFNYSQSVDENVGTGTGGAGLRLFFTRNMAVKAEMKTYVPEFRFKQWRNSEMLSVGLQWTF